MGRGYESVQPSCDWVMLDMDTHDGLFHVGNKCLLHPGNICGREPSRRNHLISLKPPSCLAFHPLFTTPYLTHTHAHLITKHNQRRIWLLHNNKHVGLNMNTFRPLKGVPNSRHCQTIINRQLGDFLHIFQHSKLNPCLINVNRTLFFPRL